MPDTDTPDDIKLPATPVAPAKVEPVAPATIDVRAALPVQGIPAGDIGTVDPADPEVAALLAADPPILVRV